jgi:hypothetical protein
MKPRLHNPWILLSFVPLFFFAAAGGAEALTLRWIDASKNEDGFKIERQRNGGHYVRIATLGPNTTSYVDSTVAPGAAYCYRVRAFNGKGSAVSSPACATMRADMTIAKGGSGAGRVLSSPAGINCGGACKASFPGQSIVTLSAVPAAGSVFAGWNGDKDCKNGMVTMKADRQCIATFKTLVASLAAKQSAAAAPASLASNSASAAPAVPTASTAAKQAPAGTSSRARSSVSGWPSGIGVFRPGTGEWFLDKNGSGVIDDCEADVCVRRFGQIGDVPVVGYWAGGRFSSLGFFDASDASWHLDLDGNGILDGCEAGACRRVYGRPGDLPVAGDWTGGGTTAIGVFRPSSGEWQLDADGDGSFDGCVVDLCPGFFGAPGDVPVVGDWSGDGRTKIGIFRPATGEWLLDFTGEGEPGSCPASCFLFGAPGDLPVAGDWDGSGADKIGVFRPRTGEWLLDLNGDGNWDGCGADLCLGPFGAPGDLPVAGNWP